MNPIELHLADARGTSHEYLITPHKGTEGVKLCRRVLGMAGAPIGRLMSGSLGDIVDAVQEGELSLDSDAGELVALLEGVDVAQIVQDLQLAIGEAGDDLFFRSLFRHTHRDGKLLADPANFDAAFQANYLELFKAAWEVIRVNGFLLFWATS